MECSAGASRRRIVNRVNGLPTAVSVAVCGVARAKMSSVTLLRDEIEMNRLLLFCVVLACSTALGAVHPKAKAERASQKGRQTPPARPTLFTGGVPYRVGLFAKPTYTFEYGYGWVGGGAPTWRGEPRRANEGVWGRDYVGVLYLRRVWPNWFHSDRYQGGTGAYLNEGPKLIHHH